MDFSFLIAVRIPKLTTGWRSSDETVLTQKTSEFKRSQRSTSSISSPLICQMERLRPKESLEHEFHRLSIADY